MPPATKTRRNVTKKPKRKTPKIRTEGDAFDQAGAAPETTERPQGEGETPAKEGAFGEQGLLMEIDHPAEKELVGLATTVRQCDERKSDVEQECGTARENLIEAMERHKLQHFVKGDFNITLKELKKVSVLKRKTEARGD